MVLKLLSSSFLNLSSSPIDNELIIYDILDPKLTVVLSVANIPSPLIFTPVDLFLELRTLMFGLY